MAIETSRGLEALDAASLRNVLSGFAGALQAHRESINNLNVYPVPDGDTGTNMSLTLASVMQEVDAAADDLDSMCAALAHGALMGARGNSGVIMAQIMRGIAGVVRTEAAKGAALDGAVMARALAEAAEGAYGAVGNPVEGTILTVIREASEAAVAAANTGAGLAAVLEAAGDRGYDALERTPQMLDVLAAAGVVDAGGAGLMLLIDSAREVVSGRPIPEPSQVAPPPTINADSSAAPADSKPSLADLRYEVMFLLDADDSKVDHFKAAWAEIGDSIVVVGGDGLWNCHVHTDDIGAAIEAGIEVGRPHKIRVTDLLEEVAEREWVQAALSATGTDSGDAQPPTATSHGHTSGDSQASAPGQDLPAQGLPAQAVPITEPDGVSVVAVGAGDGVSELLHSMGAHRVVAGGQSMNPSTAELLAAVDSLPSGAVILLPNNKNIVAVAEQLAGSTERAVAVVPTHNVVEGLGALGAFDHQAALAANHKSMAEAASQVSFGEVTQAVRTANTPIGPIKKGDWLGIGAQGIVAAAADAVNATCALLEHIIDTDLHELLTVITGADAQEADTESILSTLQQRHGDLEVEVLHGGQPLYAYYLGLE